MNLVLMFVSELTALSDYVVREFQQLVARANAWASKEHNTDGTHAAITITGLTFGGTTQTTVGAAGGATALPATPTGYVVFTIGTTEYVMPYYAKS